MRVIIQRVSEASVEIEGIIHSRIGCGLLVLVGFEAADSDEDVKWVAAKIVTMRIFSDESGKMNKSLMDIDGEMLVVSQFTLHAETKKGNRPSFIRAARPETAIPLYEKFIVAIEKSLMKPVKTGRFGADMKVKLVNDGPVTISIDSKQRE
jgi:D-aminoacyl-tRNA deacylase